MKITVLAENTSRNDLPTEHGLSLYIEADGKKLLFDTGQSDLFAKNAQILGKDLEAVDLAVISHGHYDHGGGLSAFLELNGTAPVYLSRYAFEPHFNGERYIGLDTSLQGSSRLVFTDGSAQLAQDISLVSLDTGKDVPVSMPSEGGEAMLRSFSCGDDTLTVPDDFRHEQYLLIRENGRRILFSGCSHRGIGAIAEAFRPDALVGGFHFHRLALNDELISLARTLAGYDTDYYTCHCTGCGQFAFIKPHLERASYISTGDSFDI